jgi:hypothetical protein
MSTFSENIISYLQIAAKFIAIFIVFKCLQVYNNNKTGNMQDRAQDFCIISLHHYHQLWVLSIDGGGGGDFRSPQALRPPLGPSCAYHQVQYLSTYNVAVLPEHFTFTLCAFVRVLISKCPLPPSVSQLSRPAVFNRFCSCTPRYNFSSTLYPQSCWCIIQVEHSL